MFLPEDGARAGNPENGGSRVCFDFLDHGLVKSWDEKMQCSADRSKVPTTVYNAPYLRILAQVARKRVNTANKGIISRHSDDCDFRNRVKGEVVHHLGYGRR